MTSELDEVKTMKFICHKFLNLFEFLKSVAKGGC